MVGLTLEGITAIIYHLSFKRVAWKSGGGRREQIISSN